MDVGFFLEILGMNSTSGNELRLSEFLKERLPFYIPEKKFPDFRVFEQKVDENSMNLLLDWSGTGCPEYVFCTHMDTVPPYIKPSLGLVGKGDRLPDGKIAEQDDTLITGRGSCDAKGQIFTMLNAAIRLAEDGFSNIGVLLVSGEETGSYGAKAWDKEMPGGKFVLVGEPTDNKMISASKGTKQYGLTFFGKSCHSGYPEHGESAIDIFVDFVDRLREVEFPDDPILGRTTWNIGELSSDNPHNVLSPEISFRIYFRTTFATDSLIDNALLSICPPSATIDQYGGDDPKEYFHEVPGVGSQISCFGSDAPRLTKFQKKAIYGPGSILTAHTDNEYVLLSDILSAAQTEKRIMEFAIDNKI
ncbi:MAG: M20/M25/M40 family metallo-hydrolase [Bacteroidales bacterium]|nr:M20/M25/M40 family metallo-hydrolase [Bacteroidales bacterium]